MNFQNIKLKFILHLKELAYETEITKLNLDTSDESIFAHQEEFKEFLKDTYNISDNSLVTMSVSDILKMNIVDGKLVDKNKTDESEEKTTPKSADDVNLNTDNSQSDGEINTETSEEDVENGWISGFINDLCSDEDFLANIDEDKNGEIDETEFGDFLNYAKNLDGDTESFSLDDLFKSLEMMKEGTFKIEKSDTDTDSDDIDVDETSQDSSTDDTAASTDSTPSSGGGGGGGGGGGSSYDGGSTTPSSDNNTPKTLDNMTEEELNKELDTAKATHKTNEDTLKAISDGTYQDSELEELKNKMNTDYDAYKAALDSKMQDELDGIIKDIAEVEANINQKEIEIGQQEVAITVAQSAYDSAKATHESYKSALSELQAKKNDASLSDEQKSSISSQISGIEAKIEAAKKDVEAKEKALNDEKEKLEKLKEELENLKTGENGLDALNKKKEEFEVRVETECPDAKELLATYNESKSKYDAKLSELKSKALSDVKESQERINEINTAKDKLSAKTDINKNYKTSSIDNFFASNVDYKTEYIKGAMNYQLISPKDVDPDEELPVLIYLHGLGGNASNVLSSDYCYYGIARDWNLEDFRGYIICPILENGAKDWLGDHDQKLRSIINDVCSSHKVNKDRISLAGGSLGGGGAIYMADRLKDILYRTATLSAVNAGVDTRPLNKDRERIRGWYGTLDPNWNKKKMEEQLDAKDLTVVEGANHGQMPKRVFTQDRDGNNRSDIMEWLFGDEDWKYERLNSN